MTVYQGEEHASARGLPDCGRNSGDMVIDIHTLMVDEVFLSGNWHTAKYASGKLVKEVTVTSFRAAKPLWSLWLRVRRGQLGGYQ